MNVRKLVQVEFRLISSRFALSPNCAARRNTAGVIRKHRLTNWLMLNLWILKFKSFTFLTMFLSASYWNVPIELKKTKFWSQNFFIWQNFFKYLFKIIFWSSEFEVCKCKSTGGKMSKQKRFIYKFEAREKFELQ